MLKLTTLGDREKLKRAAGLKLSELFANSKNDGVPTLFLGSGGSALSILEYVDEQTLSGNLTMGVLDERLGAGPHDRNFWNLAQTNFYKKAKSAGVKFRERVSEDTNGFEKVYVTQGIGADGHTAGLFPEKYPDRKFPRRESVSFEFLRRVDVSVVYAVGEDKKDALERVFTKEGSLDETPARVIHEMALVYVYTDLKEVRGL